MRSPPTDATMPKWLALQTVRYRPGDLHWVREHLFKASWCELIYSALHQWHRSDWFGKGVGWIQQLLLALNLSPSQN